MKTLPKRLRHAWRGSTPMVQLEYWQGGRLVRAWVVDHEREQLRAAERTQQRLRRREQQRREVDQLLADVGRILALHG